MSKLPDQFDGPEEEYDTLVNGMYNELNGLPAPGIGIPATTMTAYDTLLTPYNASYAIAKHKNTSTKTQQTTYHTNRAKLTNFLRPFVKMWLYDNDACEDDVITAAGMRLHSTTRTSREGKPSEIPVFVAEPALSHTFHVIIHTSTGNTGKPVGVHCTRIRYFVGANPPADPADFAKFQDYTKNPMELVLLATNAGMPIAMAACYVSESGSIEGNYSAIISTNVP
jgi:hypothetical protein